jgi:uncharacterized protein YukE
MDVDINIDAVEAYASQVATFSQNVDALMAELQAAISRAESSWQDLSIDIAKQHAADARTDLQNACERLGEEVTRLRAQAEWGREYLSIT